MFFIVWRGLGILVLLILGTALGVGTVIIHGVGATTPLLISCIWAVCGVVAGYGIWLFANRIESQPGRVFIDKATGREITVRKSAGSLFFIPTKYWAFIGAGLFIAFGVGAPFMPPPQPPASATISPTTTP